MIRRAEKRRRAGEKKQSAVMPLGEVKNKVLIVRGIVFHISDMVHGRLLRLERTQAMAAVIVSVGKYI